MSFSESSPNCLFDHARIEQIEKDKALAKDLQENQASWNETMSIALSEELTKDITPDPFAASFTTNSKLEVEESATLLATSFASSQSASTTDDCELDDKRSSNVYNHQLNPNPQFVHRDDKGRKVWLCMHCKKAYKVTGGTKIIRSHLLIAHDIHSDSMRQTKLKKVRGAIEDAMERAANSEAYKRRRIALEPEIPSDEPRIDPHVLEILVVKWVAAASISLNVVESNEFRSILQYLNPHVTAYLPTTGYTIRKWVDRMLEEQQKAQLERIARCQSKIHITTDAWSSPNGIPTLVIICYGIFDGKYDRILLSLDEIIGAHTGRNLALHVVKRLEDWKVFNSPHGLGFVVTDNASSMDVMMREMSEIIHEKYSKDWDPKIHRIRCQGHIINLASQSFLHTAAEDSIDDILAPANNACWDALKEEELKEWRRFGPIGKAHNNANLIARSPERLQQFRAISGGWVIRRDNVTRWHSLLRTIKSILSPCIREALPKFYKKHPSAIPLPDRITSDDYVELERIVEFLQPLEDATLFTESHKGTIERWLPNLEFVMECFEKGKERYKDHAFLSASINSGWEKLNKYYILTDESLAYALGVVLDPTQKLAYFEEAWADHPQWLISIKERVEDYWNEEYKDKISRTTTAFSNSLDVQEISQNAYLAHLQRRRRSRSLAPKDELQEYLSLPATQIALGDSFDPRIWWLSQQKRWPNLSQMAIDILGIPSMSTDAERAFSSAKLTITDRRNRLSMATVSALEKIKQWMGVDHLIYEDLLKDQELVIEQI